MLSINKPAATVKLSTLIKDYVIYNHWANRRIIEWLQSKPASIMDLKVPSSFPGIRNTLVHIWDMERSWLAHLQLAPQPESMRRGFAGTWEQVLEGLLETSDNFTNYVLSLSQEELLKTCYCNILFVGDIYRPRFEIIQHAMNHSTYHRGQLVTIGHQIGLNDAPMTDYMYYLLRVKQ